MNLDTARLCLDCEDVHDEQVCPACGSEAFAFLTRWIKPSAEPRVHPQPSRPPASVSATQARTPEQIEAFRQLIEGKPDGPTARGLVAKGVVGLAAVSLLGWAWRATAPRRGGRPQPPAPSDAA
jgi:hypothetical protein